MISSHINAVEKVLIAQSGIADNAGHPNLRGGPREWFIRGFLSDHLPQALEIGQGEIIDRNSRPGPPKIEYRNQEDIVIYRKDFPRITYSPNDSAFLAEGVIATLEIKSVLNQSQLEQSCYKAATCKGLDRSPLQGIFGDPPTNIFSYLIAFDSSAQMDTTASWLPKIAQGMTASSSDMLDIIVVLGQGVIWHKQAFDPAVPALVPATSERWAFSQQSQGNLLMLFMHMLSWIPYVIVPPDFLPYAEDALYSQYNLVP